MSSRLAVFTLLILCAFAGPLRAEGENVSGCGAEWRRIAETPALIRFQELTILKAGAWKGVAPVSLEPRLKKAIAIFRLGAEAGKPARTRPLPLDELEAAVAAFDKIRRNPATGLNGRLNGIVAGYCWHWSNGMLLVELSLADSVQVALAKARALSDGQSHEAALGVSDQAADRLLAFHGKLPPDRVRWRFLWSLSSSARSPRIAAAILTRADQLENTQQRYYILSQIIGAAANLDDDLRTRLSHSLKQPATGAEDLQLRVLVNAFAAGLPISRERLKAVYLKSPEVRRKTRMLWMGRRLKVDLENEKKFLQWIDKQPEILKMP